MLKVKNGEKVILKSFVARDSKKGSKLYFVDFINPETFETTGDMMFRPNNETPNESEVIKVSQLLRHPVMVDLSVNPYDSRASVTCVGINPLTK